MMKKYFIVLFALILASCTLDLNQVLTLIEKDDVHSVKKGLQNNKVELNSKEDIAQVFNLAIENHNDEIVKLLVESDFFKEIKSNSNVISNIVTSDLRYDTKMLIYQNNIPMDLDLLVNDISMPASYWLAINAFSEDFLRYSRNINNYSIVVEGVPIVEVIATKHYEIISDLELPLESINIKNGNGCSPLAVSIEKGNTEAAQYLIQNGADIRNMSNDNPWFTLAWNWREDYYNLADQFIEKGLNLSINSNGIEAFKGIIYTRSASLDEQIEFIAWLVKNGFISELRDIEGKQATDYLFQVRPSIDVPDENELSQKKSFNEKVLTLLV